MKNIEKKDWAVFRKTGLVLIINQLLHVFGWCIVFETEQSTGEIKSVFPARTRYRGFSESDQDEDYKRVTHYMKDNVDDLIKEVEP